MGKSQLDYNIKFEVYMNIKDKRQNLAAFCLYVIQK